MKLGVILNEKENETPDNIHNLTMATAIYNLINDFPKLDVETIANLLLVAKQAPEDFSLGLARLED